MSIVYTHALNYSQVESRKNNEIDSNIGYSQTQQYCHQNSLLSSLIDTRNGFMNEETFRNDNDQHHKHYSPSTSSDMETMFTNSQHLLVKQEENDPFSQGIQYNGYSNESPSQMIYQTHQNHALLNDFEASFSAVSSLDSENYDTETKIASSMNCSNLIRHNSSPAEFFSNYSLHNGIGTKNIGNDNASTKSYMPNFINDYWATSTFTAPKTSINNGQIFFSTSNTLETQDLDFGYQKHGLRHQLSLPSSSTKMTSMDKYFHIQGSVPCKIRAKRGFATHPRSIAERERRIRISARIKKLQELFPNSDKQTSTADMLDVAVDYIKDLRKQLKILSDTKAKCSCTSN
ncbi:unnamed protein product [Vicia faba]|uniref:BHLH domain-containing protein n=1 Tax=Vicia faba TaxID=3906 RepID=A0AAV1AA49_VICFA|nr:unnamed protein product [Vicia faba]